MEYERQEEEGVVSWHIVLLSANVPVTGVGTNLSLLKKLINNLKKKNQLGLKGADTFRIRTSEKPYKKIVVIKLARFLRSLKDT